MKFLVLIAGIIVFCAAAGYWVIDGGPLALGVAFAGLATIAGEGFKIAQQKEIDQDAMDKAEEELEKDAKADGITK